MGIERERKPPLAHRPWGLQSVFMLARVLVHRVHGIRVFGFSRSPLKEIHRREDIDGHL